MAKITFVAVCVVCGATSLALPMPEERQELQNLLQQNNGELIGEIGTALVPLVSAIISYVAAGLATAIRDRVTTGPNGNFINPNNLTALTFDTYMLNGIEGPFVLLPSSAEVSKEVSFAAKSSANSDATDLKLNTEGTQSSSTSPSLEFLKPDPKQIQLHQPNNVSLGTKV